MNAEIRIVAGSLRGRKVACQVNPDLRPTPQRIREAFFSIMGNAIPDRIFVDIFAGTGVIGLEALSRGAKMAYFIERDLGLAQSIEKHLKEFKFADKGRLYRTDAYRWISAWLAVREPVNFFLSPPFPDLTERPTLMFESLKILQEKVHPESVIVLQEERGVLEEDPFFADWELRTYGRNMLLIWQKADPDTPIDPTPPVSDWE